MVHVASCFEELVCTIGQDHACLSECTAAVRGHASSSLPAGLPLQCTASEEAQGHHILRIASKREQSIPEMATVDVELATDASEVPFKGFQSVSWLQAGEEAKALPMVLLPHGSPWLRDTWGMNSSGSHVASVYWPYALATRGYAVLQPQFRCCPYHLS